MELFLVLAVCAYQPYQSSACNAVAGAYFDKIGGQPVLDEINRKYVDKLPVEIKDTGTVGYALYTKHIRIGLYRGLSWDMQIDKRGSTSESVVNSLAFSKSFP